MLQPDLPVATIADAPAVDDFRRRYGFARSEVTLANWRRAPFSRWSFANLRQLVPTAPMASGSGAAAAPAPPALPEALTAEPVSIDGDPVAVATLLADLGTDILMLLKDGRVAGAWSAPHAATDQPHLLFSVSKSLTGLLAGALAERGALQFETPVVSLLPEAAGSAFGDATVRQLLDMRVSLAVDEIYGGTDGWGSRYCRAVLWDPPDGKAAPSHLRLLLSVGKGAEPHGGPFRYRSATTDVLGVVLERAGGRPFAELMADHLWRPLAAGGEAYVSLDREGTAQAAGGMAVTAADLARVGEMMRLGGAAGSRQVLPATFVEDTLRNGDAVAWHQGDGTPLLPGGRYRNQWYSTGDPGSPFYATGIFGQWLYVDPARAVTIVKLSSHPVARSERIDAQTLQLFAALAQRL